MKWKPEITTKQFEKGYISRSMITRRYYDKWFITMPCNCGQDGCQGWATVGKSPDRINDHCQLYFPPVAEYLEYISTRNNHV